MGGDLGGDWGDGSPKFEVGTAHVFVPPIFREVLFNILRSTVKEFRVVKIEVFLSNRTIVISDKVGLQWMT